MEGKKFHDIYEYIYVPIWKSIPFIATTITLVILSIGITIFFIIRAKRRKEKETTLTPKEIALAKLSELSPKDLKTKLEYKLFYFKLTEIFKNFLQQDRNWKTKEKTDDELIKYLKEKQVNPQTIKQLVEIFEDALLIKFANQQALQDQTSRDLKEMISIVTQL